MPHTARSRPCGVANALPVARFPLVGSGDRSRPTSCRPTPSPSSASLIVWPNTLKLPRSSSLTCQRIPCDSPHATGPFGHDRDRLGVLEGTATVPPTVGRVGLRNNAWPTVPVATSPTVSSTTPPATLVRRRRCPLRQTASAPGADVCQRVASTISRMRDWMSAMVGSHLLLAQLRSQRLAAPRQPALQRSRRRLLRDVLGLVQVPDDQDELAHQASEHGLVELPKLLPRGGGHRCSRLLAPTQIHAPHSRLVAATSSATVHQHGTPPRLDVVRPGCWLAPVEARERTGQQQEREVPPP